jgi:hypothetical protein
VDRLNALVWFWEGMMLALPAGPDR